MRGQQRILCNIFGTNVNAYETMNILYLLIFVDVQMTKKALPLIIVELIKSISI